MDERGRALPRPRSVPRAYRPLRKFLVLGAGISLILGMTTLWALERSGVALVRTTGIDGSVRETHVWYVEDGEGIWLEANNPRTPWYLNVKRDASVDLWREGETRSYTATADTSQSAHDAVRERMAAKYGIRDTWVQLFAGYTDSVAVYLTPRPEAGASLGENATDTHTGYGAAGCPGASAPATTPLST